MRLAVLAARRQLLVGMIDILRDWAALGVIDEVFVVAVEDISSTSVTLPATQIGAAGCARVLLGDTVSVRHDIDLIRLGVVELPQAAPQVSLSEAGELRGALTRVLPQAPIVTVHALAVQHHHDRTGGWDVEGGTWLGWHNVLLVPENSASPAAGISPVIADPDHPMPLTHLVAGACGLLGLFTGHQDSVFDSEPDPVGSQVRLARVFTRFLTADALEHEVLARVTDVRGRYPVPRYGGRQVVVVDDELAASGYMADLLLAKHRDVMPRTRQMPTPAQAPRIGALQALGMFFTFLWAAIRNAPRALLDRMTREVSDRIARAVQGYVFGPSDAAYTVVVNGMTADGRPLESTALDAALDELSERSGPHIPHLPENLSALWHDYVDAGKTLLDAGTRATDLPPLLVGGTPAVVSTTAMVVPAPGDGFAVSQGLSVHLPGWFVPGGDYVRALSLHRRLQTLAQQHPDLGDAVAHERRRLDDWIAQQDGYSGRLGRHLGDATLRTMAEITSINERLRQARQEVSLPADLQARHASLGRTLLIYAGVTLALVILVVLLINPGPLSWEIGVPIAVLLVIGWMVGSLLAFVRHQRELFAILHRRGEDIRISEVLRQHLQEAIADARRLNRAYRQYLDWVRAFGAFAHAPLGTTRASAVRELLVGPGLPRNVMIGVAEAQEQVVADAVDALRRGLFEVTWLDAGWNQFVWDLPVGLGEWQYQLREQPDVLWSDPRISATGSVLSQWSAAVAEHRDRRGVPDAFVSRLYALIDADHLGVATQLRDTVRLRRPDSGAEEVLQYAQFVAGLENADTDSRAYVFDSALLAPAPETMNANAVATTTVRRARTGLTISLVVTQLGLGLRLADLRSEVGPDDDAAPVDHGQLDLPPV